MPSLQKVGLALQGFSAGVAGRGQEFIENLSTERKQALLEDAFTVQQQLQTGDVPGARATLQARLSAIAELGGDDSDTLGILKKIDAGDVKGAFNDVSTVVDFGQRSGLLTAPKAVTGQSLAPADVRSFQFFNALSPEKKKEMLNFKRAGKIRNVGGVPSLVTAAGDALPLNTLEGAATLNAELNAVQETAKSAEIGKLTAEFNLKPRIQKAVTIAVANATMLSDQAKLDKRNESTFKVYETGMRGLVAGLDSTFTGPFVSMLPAVTANAQIADGAIAAMAPVMKQMFRAAGEGIFTDKDQELLLEMIPSRDDLPKSRQAKLANIDAIVRAKLGIMLPDESLPDGFDQLSPQDQQELRQRLGGG